MMTVPDGMVYCPYTDREIPVEKSNSEHIIPLSLVASAGSKYPWIVVSTQGLVANLMDAFRMNSCGRWYERGMIREGIAVKSPLQSSRRRNTGKDDRLAQVYFHQKGRCACLGRAESQIHERKGSNFK